MANELVFGSSEYWLTVLNSRLNDQAKRVKHLDAYYRGDHNLSFATNKFREAFGGLFAQFSDNFCRLVPDAVHERLIVQGFRMGTNKPADADAWRIWQGNNMDVVSSQAIREALVKSECSFSVWFGSDPDLPIIRAESPDQMIVAVDPGSRQRLAAFKRWQGFDGRWLATLYLPDRIEKYQSASAPSPVVISEETTGSVVVTTRPDMWEKRDVPDEPWPLPNPLGEVPVIPMVNMPRLDGAGEAEHESVMPLQDAINKEVADMLVASEFAAFRQRWATGVDIPLDNDGNPIDDLKAAVSRAWMTENENAKFGDFSATDLKNYVDAIDMLIQHVATISRTPPHYLLSTNVMPNGESQSAAEAGLVATCKDRQRDFSEPLEDVMRLAFRVIGDEAKASVRDSQVIWADPEYRSQSALTDSLIKLQKLGIPNEVLWEKAQFSPTEIDRIKALNRAAELENAAAAATALANQLARPQLTTTNGANGTATVPNGNLIVTTNGNGNGQQ